MINFVEIMGIRISKVTSKEALELIKKWAVEDKQRFVVTPNPEMLLETQKNHGFKQAINHADLALPDGVGLQWAAAYLTNAKAFNRGIFTKYFDAVISLLRFFLSSGRGFDILPERVTGTDLMAGLLEDLELKFYFLGAAEGIANELGQKYIEKQIKIVGSFSGTPDEEFDDQQVEGINESQATVLFVAFGAPKQELWIARNLHKMLHVKVAIGVGGAFDFLNGNVKRAPIFLRKIGLEWLFRLYKEPRKRFKRIFDAIVRFPIEVVRYKEL